VFTDNHKKLNNMEFINEDYVFGYFLTSPLEHFFSKNYGINNNSTVKPYKAFWMINDFNLYIAIVNAIIKDLKMYTIDFFPDFPDDDILLHYKDYSGVLNMELLKTDEPVPSVFSKYINPLTNQIVLKILNGKLIH
jgi:hypothetical protein